MNIRLEMPLFINSHKTIDGRGSHVEISHRPCICIWNVTNIIVHSFHIHDCSPNVQGNVILSESLDDKNVDGDAIFVVTSKHIWIDHNTLSHYFDGLVDVTLASIVVSISNNYFLNHDKVLMMLGHNDDFIIDKDMKVTVAYNYFGPALLCRHGYMHVEYAIGGRMNPTIKSEGN
eukprot:Gb_37157 [translate_table: standard]